LLRHIRLLRILLGRLLLRDVRLWFLLLRRDRRLRFLRLRRVRFGMRPRLWIGLLWNWRLRRIVQWIRMRSGDPGARHAAEASTRRRVSTTNV
jgi:hypothetical protein